MRSQEIQDQVYRWACTGDFNAPYGVLTGSGSTKRGRKYLAVTFGRARTLDATVEIFNNTFIIVRTSRTNSQVFNSVDEMQDFLNTL